MGLGTAGRLRLLYVATSKNDGGIERYSIQMATQMLARGFDLRFACRPGEIVERLGRELGIPTRPWRVRNSGDISASVRLADLIIGEEIDIVHVHSRRDYIPALLGVALARRRLRRTGRRPHLILQTHLIRAIGEPARLSGRVFEWGTDVILAVSNAVRERLITEHGFDTGFVRLLHNGVDTSAFHSAGTARAQSERAARRGAWGLAEDALVIGMIGRLDAKGQLGLLSVLPALAKRYPNLHVVLVGAEGIPGERERLYDAAEYADVTDRLTLTGPRGDIPDLLPAFDILAHLPLDESFGLALVEAMASGLPTVATDIGGCRDVVQHEETGLLVSPGDTDALLGALDRLLSDHSLRRRMGEAGIRVAEAEFRIGRQMDRLEEIYEQLCPTLPAPAV